MVLRFLVLLVAYVPDIMQAAPTATQLPIVDLGYSLHQASSFNVSYWKEFGFVFLLNPLTSRPGERTTSPIFAMPSPRLQTSGFVPQCRLRVSTDPLIKV